MDREILVRYFHHLAGLLDKLASADPIGFHDVAPVRAELRNFRSRAADIQFLSPELKKIAATIDLRIDDKYLEGGPKTRLLDLYAMIAGRSVFLRIWRDKNRQKIEPEIDRLRSELWELTKAVSL